MASINKITEMIAVIKTIYPYFAKDTDVKALVQTWAVLLETYHDKAVEIAIRKCLQICKTPPTPADVIEQLNKMIQAESPTAEELWNVLHRCIIKARKYVYQFDFTHIEDDGLTQGQKARKKVDELYKSLPNEIKTFLGNKDGFLELVYSDDKELKYTHNRFLKEFPQIQACQETVELRKLMNDESIMIDSSNTTLGLNE